MHDVGGRLQSTAEGRHVYGSEIVLLRLETNGDPPSAFVAAFVRNIFEEEALLITFDMFAIGCKKQASCNTC